MGKQKVLERMHPEQRVVLEPLSPGPQIGKETECRRVHEASGGVAETARESEIEARLKKSRLHGAELHVSRRIC